MRSSSGSFTFAAAAYNIVRLRRLLANVAERGDSGEWLRGRNWPPSFCRQRIERDNRNHYFSSLLEFRMIDLS